MKKEWKVEYLWCEENDQFVESLNRRNVLQFFFNQETGDQRLPQSRFEIDDRVVFGCFLVGLELVLSRLFPDTFDIVLSCHGSTMRKNGHKASLPCLLGHFVL